VSQVRFDCLEGLISFFILYKMGTPLQDVEKRLTLVGGFGNEPS